MNLYTLLRTSLRVIFTHSIRSILTILGIMIGIAAIIVTFSIGSGAEKKIREQIVSMGELATYIIPGNIIERGRVRSTLASPPKLTEQDLYALKHQSDAVVHVSRGHDSLQLIEYGIQGTQERVYGTDENMLAINDNTIAYGTYFSEYHLQHRSNVVVLGNEIARKLFKQEYPLGKTVTIKKIPFTVIGVLDPIDYFWGIQDPNTRAYVPFTVAKKYFKKPGERDFDLGFIALRSRTPQESEIAVRNTRRTLRFLHGIENGEPDDFTIFDQQSIANSAQQASKVIKLFGLIAASISLLVGGIGVMNIMLVSVQERVNEIGLRLALGATQRLVQTQFLLEAVTLSTFGGILGVLLGIAAQYAISRFTNLSGSLEFIPLIISLLMTILTGIFFGFYPARKASLLHPVQALRER